MGGDQVGLDVSRDMVGGRGRLFLGGLHGLTAKLLDYVDDHVEVDHSAIAGLGKCHKQKDPGSMLVLYKKNSLLGDRESTS